MSIASEITRLQNAKADLKTAIVAKGVEISDTDTIDTYASKVEAIESGGGKIVVDNCSYFCYHGVRADLVPKLYTSNCEYFTYMYKYDYDTEVVPELDTSNAIEIEGMFDNTQIVIIPKLNTSRVEHMNYVCRDSKKLTTVGGFDMLNAYNVSSLFKNCAELTTLNLFNIRNSIQVGSGTSWGHKLTLDSLIGLIYELTDVGSSRTLTVGTANMEKLANVYVKLIDITDDMRTADPYIDSKYPFVVCESTDEGAIPITDYVTSKRWSLA